MKTSILEKTLIDSLGDADDSTFDEQLFLNNIKDHTQENKPSNDNQSVNINKPTVWGDHLTNKPQKQTLAKPIENIISIKFSKKLFDGCNFKKRNPRKNFVKKKTTDIESSQSVSDDITNITSNDSNIQEDSAFQDDSNLSTVTVDSDMSINNTVKISNMSTIVPQPLSLLQKSSGSFEASSKLISLNKKFDNGWLERCNESNSKLTNLNTNVPDVKPTKEIESDTDIVYESDNETQDIPLYSSQRIKAQEESCDVSSNIIQKNNVTESVNDILRSSKKRYNSDENLEECVKQPKVLKMHKSEINQLSSKDNNKKLKFEEKISSGKAGENFVRLDMKRKIYSRGKRSVQTTTYKKKQWKNRKKELGEDYSATGRTSLLKCFKCGDIGHYSKNCLKS